MSRGTLNVEPRDASGKSPVARRMRREGRIPGILYGADQEHAFSVDLLDLQALLRHHTTIVDVKLAGNSHIGIIKDFQVHPVRGVPQHVDIQEVRMDQTVKAEAPIVLVGEAEGVKGGGVLTQSVHEVAFEATPGNIPEAIEVDISAMAIGDSMTLGEVVPPEGVVILDSPDGIVASIAASRASRSAASVTEGEGAAEGEEAAEGDAEASSEG